MGTLRNSHVINLLFQLMTYGLIGVLCAFLDLTIFKVLISFENSVSISNILSITSALVVSYILNSKFTYMVRLKNMSNFFRFLIFGVITIISSTLLVRTLVTDFMLDPSIAKTMSILPAALLQFSLNRFLNFK